jgi:hypothetical protein
MPVQITSQTENLVALATYERPRSALCALTPVHVTSLTERLAALTANELRQCDVGELMTAQIAAVTESHGTVATDERLAVPLHTRHARVASS